MKPYKIVWPTAPKPAHWPEDENEKPEVLWIDLDHVVAIAEPRVFEPWAEDFNAYCGFTISFFFRSHDTVVSTKILQLWAPNPETGGMAIDYDRAYTLKAMQEVFDKLHEAWVFK